jgi:hypothetical protein
LQLLKVVLVDGNGERRVQVGRRPTHEGPGEARESDRIAADDLDVVDGAVPFLDRERDDDQGTNRECARMGLQRDLRVGGQEISVVEKLGSAGHQPDVAADATHQRRRAVEEPDVEAELDEEERRGERDAGEGRDELAAVEDE